MRPPKGQLLEIAWGAWNSARPDTFVSESHLLQLPIGATIPKAVSALTGLTIESMTSASPAADVCDKLKRALQNQALIVIHYAQFEKPFLLDLLKLQSDELPIVCTYQLIQRLLPSLPSKNIRGSAGYFGHEVATPQRAGAHVEATRHIWRGLLPELKKLGLIDHQSITEWLKHSHVEKNKPYAYRFDRLKRLQLTEQPGVYRMLNQAGEVLYVGKATSLRSRVNSYFRGKKGRDRRKLEMLTRVWDIRVTECGTPLEAALLESDEIKKLNPHYNLTLKRGTRRVVFYSRDFTSEAATYDSTHLVGPFRENGHIEMLRRLVQFLSDQKFGQLFYLPLPPSDLEQGFLLLCMRLKLKVDQLRTIRPLLAQGLWILKNYQEPPASEVKSSSPPDRTSVELTVEEIADKLARLLRRAATEYRRSQKLTQLLNSRITIDLPTGPRQLIFLQGQLQSPETLAGSTLDPWATLSIDTYDRMSILEAELKNYNHRLEKP